MGGVLVLLATLGVSLLLQTSEDIAGRVLVPSVTGMTLQGARTTITQADLSVRSITREPSTSIPAGDVLRQNPEPGSAVAPGAIVDLVVAVEPPPTMPDVRTLSKEAAALLLNESFIDNVEFVFSESTEPFGTVIAQSPTAGSFVPQGTRVSLAISDGRIYVPLVTDMWKSGARRALQVAGLDVRVDYVRDKSAAGKVLSQAPIAGTVVPRGTLVVLTVGRAKAK